MALTLLEPPITLRTGALSTTYIGKDLVAPAARMEGCQGFEILANFVKSGSSGARVTLWYAGTLGPTPTTFQRDQSGAVVTSANASTGLKSATWFQDRDFGSKAMAAGSKYAFAVSKVWGMWAQIRVKASSAASAATCTVQIQRRLWA